MTDLTEQFNNDELDENKLYYFKQKMSEEIEVGRPFALNMVRAMDDTYLDWFLIDKVLAPVPSYEELVKLKEELKDFEYEHKQYAMSYEDTFCKLETARKENKQLKEQINKYILDSINRGTANAVTAVKEFGMPERIEELVKQNTKLKELLKECREHLITYKRDDLNKGYVVYDGSYLIDKIIQVLGEDK